MRTLNHFHSPNLSSVSIHAPDGRKPTTFSRKAYLMLLQSTRLHWREPKMLLVDG
jgi:hypothetical protein